MQTAEQIGDEILETAESVHFIPSDTGMELSLPEVMGMEVGTTLEGHMRIRTMDEVEYLEGTMIVMAEGLHFEPT
jgi:hypothetical protein